MRPLNRRQKIQPRTSKAKSYPTLPLIRASERYENKLKMLRIQAGLLPKNQYGGSRYPLPPHLENATIENMVRWEKLYQNWNQHLQRFKPKLIIEAKKVGLKVDWKATSFFQDEKNVKLQLSWIRQCLENAKRRRKK